MLDPLQQREADLAIPGRAVTSAEAKESGGELVARRRRPQPKDQSVEERCGEAKVYEQVPTESADAALGKQASDYGIMLSIAAGDELADLAQGEAIPAKPASIAENGDASCLISETEENNRKCLAIGSEREVRADLVSQFECDR